MSRELLLQDFGDRASWLRGRTAGLGASDVPSLFQAPDGTSLGYSSLTKLFLEKTNQLAPEELTAEHIEMGNRLEPVIADIYVDRTGRQIKQYGPFCVAQHETIPFLRATPDRWVTAAPDRMGSGLVQIKNSNWFMQHDWDDGPPLGIQIQVQAEMAVTGYDWDSVAVLVGGCRFMYFDVERDPVFITELEDRVRWFWSLVESRVAPPIDGDKETLAAIKRLYPHATSEETVRLPEEAVAWADALAAAKVAAKAAKAERNKAESAMRSLIGSAMFGELPDGRKFSLKPTNRKEYTKTVKASSFRTLRLVGGDADDDTLP